MRYFCSSCSAETANGFDYAVFAKMILSQKTVRHRDLLGLPSAATTTYSTMQWQFLGWGNYTVCGTCAMKIFTKSLFSKSKDVDRNYEALDFMTFHQKVRYKIKPARRTLFNHSNFENYISANNLTDVTEEDLKKFLKIADATEDIPKYVKSSGIIPYVPPEIYIGQLLGQVQVTLVFNQEIINVSDIPKELRQYALKVHDVLLSI